MPDIDWNRTFWSDYGWPADGEEWSSEWGDAKTQWWTTIMPRIARCVPAGRIVEIAPGRGRWTRFLLNYCQSYGGYDVSAACVDYCRTQFKEMASKARAEFFETDGRSLACESANGVDFVFSFDSLVHVESDVIEGYLAECVRVLAPGGRAFLHHSNLAAFGGGINGYDHLRGKTVSACTLKERCRELGLIVLVQEAVSWQMAECIDCFSLIAKPPIDGFNGSVTLTNPEFWGDIARLRRNISPYLAV